MNSWCPYIFSFHIYFPKIDRGRGQMFGFSLLLVLITKILTVILENNIAWPKRKQPLICEGL
jgi:hypothetical protein